MTGQCQDYLETQHPEITMVDEPVESLAEIQRCDQQLSR